MQYLMNVKTSIQTKQSPVSFVQQFSFLSKKIFQSVRQLSSNISEDFAKTGIIVKIFGNKQCFYTYHQTFLVNLLANISIDPKRLINQPS